MAGLAIAPKSCKYLLGFLILGIAYQADPRKEEYHSQYAKHKNTFDILFPMTVAVHEIDSSQNEPEDPENG
jgi:hypothetical protein